MMQHILIVKIKLKELFQIKLPRIELIKLLGIVNMIDINKH